MPPTTTCFAVTAPGLEAITTAELKALGISGTPEPGGVAWSGSLGSVALANLWLRSATRVIVRVAEFRARTFFELERHARLIEWGDYAEKGTPVAFRVTCKKSKLYHSDAVAQRLIEAAKRAGIIADAAAVEEDDAEVEAASPVAPPPPPAASSVVPVDPQLFIVRFSHDQCTISADTSGALLHRRGYRLALAKAPLRETLAAAMLMGVDWDGTVPLLDPMCGSGTIPIEAALIARRMAPGLNRTFAFERWPDHHAKRWASLRDRARSSALPRAAVRIVGADRDAGAIAAARANAERAGVATDIEWATRAVSAAEPLGVDGAIVTNPPYGVRVGNADGARDLYAQLGHVARRDFLGWTVALLTPDRGQHGQLGMPLAQRFRTTNGGIGVQLVAGRVVKARPHLTAPRARRTIVT